MFWQKEERIKQEIPYLLNLFPQLFIRKGSQRFSGDLFR